MDGNEKKRNEGQDNRENYWKGGRIEENSGAKEERAEDARMEERLRDLTDDVQVPPSLEPEAVEEMLLKRKREKKRKTGGRHWRRNAGIAAAACLCLAVGAVAAVNFGGLGNLVSGTADQSASGKNTAAESGAAKAGTVESMVTAADYDEIYDYIQEGVKQQEKQARMYNSGSSATGDGAVAYSTEDSAMMDSGAAAVTENAGEASGDYSDTNVREEGVGEADVVKTDGEYLYIVARGKVRIVDIRSDEMDELTEIGVDEDCEIREIYVEDDRLAVLYYRAEYDDGETGYDGYFRNFTCTDVYDISDPSNPEKLNTISQSGTYNTMRARGGYLYVLSDFYADTTAPRSGVSMYVPEVQGGMLDASDIYMPQGGSGDRYTVISAFSLADPAEKTDGKAVFGNSGICYVSTENIYITESYYGLADVTQTSVRKVSYHDGQLEGVAQTKIDGTLNNSFSIDEYNGYLRLVTTVEPCDTGDVIPIYGEGLFGPGSEDVTSNSLYVLDGELEITGQITGLAEEERIYSARFMGDTGYFVTFKQVDPLFSVDLSDPADPRIIGELKIPGFSDYLHPYGDGRLLGIGMDVDEEGVTTEGVKVSMFDISDPSDVKEASKYVLEDMYGTDVYDYRAVFVDVEKNLFGFTAYGDTTEYYVFSYDETEGFREVFSRELMSYGNVRGLYSGERFYLVDGNTVISYTLDEFEKIDDIVL